jgi:hypothetical protein
MDFCAVILIFNGRLGEIEDQRRISYSNEKYPKRRGEVLTR